MNNTMPSTTPTAPAKKQRDPYFSNAKFGLIALVICGHSWSDLLDGSNSVYAFYMTLYNFHMPAFIFISGYFSKTFSGKPRQLKRLITGVMVPYVIFSLILGLLKIWTDDKFQANLLTPFYITWFLAALFVWRLTAPFWHILRFPVLIATLISIGAIFLELPGTLDLGRILQFLPFFVAGMFMRREHFSMLQRPIVRVVGTLLSLGILVMSFMYAGELDRNWIYFNEGAEQMDLDPISALPLKIALMASAAILIATYLSWVPQKQLPFTHLGDHTMYPYLLHGVLIITLIDGVGLYDLVPFVHTGPGAIVVTLTAIAAAFVLSSKPVRVITGPIVEPKLDWIFKREKKTGDEPAASTVSGPTASGSSSSKQ